MALKQTSVNQKELVEGAPVSGYLISTGIIELSFKGGAPGPVPKVILQDKDGGKFSVLLGKAAIDDLALQTPGLWTEIRKGKSKKSNGGFTFAPYTFLQDPDLKIQL